MRMNVVLFSIVFVVISPSVSWSLPTELSGKWQNSSSSTEENKYLSLSSHQPHNYKMDKLINNQSENVRHIIAAEQRKQQEQQDKHNESKQTKKEKALVSIEEERYPTLEELRIKCQHFSRLFGLNPYASSTEESLLNIDHPSSTADPDQYHNRPIIEITRRPVFIRNKPTFVQKNTGGFYVTVSSNVNEISTTRRPFWLSSTTYPKVHYAQPDSYNSKFSSSSSSSTHLPSSTTTTTTTTTTTLSPNVDDSTTTTEKPKIKIKYTKFEPVILQKTILTDGRIMYHWHRSLPTAPVDLAAQPTPFEFPVIPAVLPISQSNLESTAVTQPTTTTTTTTTERSSWLFVPFSSLFGGSHEEETTTEQPHMSPSTTTSSTSTTPKPSTTEVSIEEPLKPAQLKLVVPIHYDDIDSNLAAQGNAMSYYRQTTNAPSLQVIKTLGVPQNIPRYSLGYTGTGYGLTMNNLPYGPLYGPDYLNYQPFSRGVPLKREDGGN